MKFLALLLSIIIRLAVAFQSDFRDIFDSEYSPELSDEHTRLDPLDTDVDDATENIKYDELLHLLHNEKSNRAVLAHINKKDKENTTAINGNIDKDEYDIDYLRFFRKKRSAVKWLRSLFHSNSTAPPKKKPILTQPPQNLNLNSTFTELLVNLTNAIKSFNQNLVTLNTEIIYNEGYVMIKLPLKNIGEANLTQNVEKRSKREINLASNETAASFENPNANVTHVNETKMIISNDAENTNKSHIARSEPIEKNHDVVLNATEPIKRDVDYNLNVSAHKHGDNQINITINSSLNHDLTVLREAKSNNTNETLINVVTTTKILPLNNVTVLKTNATEEVIANKMDLLKSTVENNDSIPINNTRRMIYQNFIIPVDRREELYQAIERLYGEINDEIAPGKQYKQLFSQRVMFKIGYILAHLDSLELSLNKLMKKMILNKSNWATTRLMHVQQKLTLSKRLVDNVMTYLYEYIRELPGGGGLV